MVLLDILHLLFLFKLNIICERGFLRPTDYFFLLAKERLLKWSLFLLSVFRWATLAVAQSRDGVASGSKLIRLSIVYRTIWEATEFITPLVVWSVFYCGYKWVYAINAVHIWHLQRCYTYKVKGWPVVRVFVILNFMTIKDNGLILLVLEHVDTVIRARAGLRVGVHWGMLVFFKFLLFFFNVLFCDLSLIMIPLENMRFWL